MIKIKNVSKSYGALKVLDDITFDVNSGEFIAIFGKSGIGKTTLLNILATFDKPDKGEVIVEKNNIIGAPEKIIEKIRINNIGYAHQSNYMIEFLSLYENIALPLILAGNPRKERNKIVDELLKEVGLEEVASNRPSQLSFGERKRACIARALINEPRIVFIDEPTANLDAANKDRILALLCKVQKKGTTIVVATHDHSVTKHAKVLELASGKIALQKINED